MPSDPGSPRVLLFGHPGSGKSSLLGALQRAGETQGETLGAEVIDPSGRLPRIRDHLYHDAPFECTNTELVTYEVRLRPWRVGAKPAESIVIHDCDGAAALALLKHPDPITEREVRGTVASAVVQADLIAIVVNAGAEDDELDAAFDEFLMFLERVHGRKAFEREVGGFPIVMILTQCDLLAEPGQSRGDWEADVQTRLQHALRRFADFLDDQQPEAEAGPYLPFGSVELHGYAVAVREPNGTEPFGVAECFRDIFARARGHRDRVKLSQRSLKRTLWAVACAVWLLFAGGVAVTVLQPNAADPGLADRVQSFRDNEPAAAERLAAKNLGRNRRTLAGFQSDPGFFAIPEDLRSFVGGRLHEMDDYQAYQAKLAAMPAPADARSLEELSLIESKLIGELSLPPQYTWGETEAARLRDKWLADVPALRAAEAAWQEWYRGQVNQALALTHAKSFEGEWRTRVAAVEAALPPFDSRAAIASSPELPLPRGEAVTNRIAAEFDRVYQASRDWEFAKSRLGRLRDVADVLGLTSDTTLRALDLPPPGPGIDSTTLPGERWKLLIEQFPRSGDTPVPFTEWDLANFPEPGRGVLANRARESLGNGARHARNLLAAKRTTDTPAGWRDLAGSLNDPAIHDWGRLLHVLTRMQNPQAEEPVAELAAFLKAPEFKLDLRGFELVVPLALRVPPVVPAGNFTISIGESQRVFKLAGEGTTEGLNTVYRFLPEQPGALLYKPGDALKAELPVRSGDQRFTLAWNDGRTQCFQFDRLSREPHLGANEPATGVVLTPILSTKVPRLPLLLPDVQK